MKIFAKPSLSSNYRPEVEGLRGCAALYVMFHHIMVQEFDKHVIGRTIAEKALVFALDFGHFAVNIFIVISGYCLMLPLLSNSLQLKGGWQKFYRRRFNRIIPTYMIALLISTFLASTVISKKTNTHWDLVIPVTTTDIITHIFLLQDLFLETIDKINHALWSISVEFRIYLFFPILIFIWRKKGPLLVLTLAVAISFIALLLRKYVHINGFTNSPQPGIYPYMLLFFFGMCAAWIGRAYSLSVRRFISPLTIISFLILIACCIQATHPERIPASGNLIDVLVGISAGIWLLVIESNNLSGRRQRSIFRYLTSPVFITLGTFAYSIYLIHAPLVQLIWQYAVHPLHLNVLNSTLTMLIAGTPVILSFCYLFFILFERPFINKRKTKIHQEEQQLQETIVL